MTKPISRRFILNASLVLSLLIAMAGWVVTKTTANAKAIAGKSPALGVALKNPGAKQPKLLLTTRHDFQQPAQGEKTIDQVQKNIKVLTGIPQAQLIPMMNFFAASLGVRCNYCHVNNAGEWDYPADTKPEKNTAREMITMVLSVNKTTKGTNGEVSCFTCHRGRTSPVGVPALPLPQPTPRPGQGAAGGSGTPTATMPTADDILNKYIAALGGQAAIDKLKTRVMKGTYEAANGLTATYEVDQAAPDRFHVIFTTPQGTMERGFNGSAAWEKNPRGVMDMPSEQLAQMKAIVGMFSDIKLKEQFTRMNVRKDKIDGRDVYVILATTADRKRERLYFDAETGLLLRRTTATQTPIGVIPQETNYEDYREVDGVKIPFTIRTVTLDAGSTATRKYTEIKVNVPVDDSTFNKPPAPPPAATPPKP
jgi:photosynthetic reaction center cytochrome c subunit